jgi:hypothetical protein
MRRQGIAPRFGSPPHKYLLSGPPLTRPLINIRPQPLVPSPDRRLLRDEKTPQPVAQLRVWTRCGC